MYITTRIIAQQERLDIEGYVLLYGEINFLIFCLQLHYSEKGGMTATLPCFCVSEEVVSMSSSQFI